MLGDVYFFVLPVLPDCVSYGWLPGVACFALPAPELPLVAPVLGCLDVALFARASVKQESFALPVSFSQSAIERVFALLDADVPADSLDVLCANAKFDKARAIAELMHSALIIMTSLINTTTRTSAARPTLKQPRFAQGLVRNSHAAHCLPGGVRRCCRYCETGRRHATPHHKERHAQTTGGRSRSDSDCMPRRSAAWRGVAYSRREQLGSRAN